MFKADRKAAYKQLPLDPTDQVSAIVALSHPAGNRWYGFATRTLIFGSFAAVLRYNVVPQILTAWFNRYLGPRWRDILMTSRPSPPAAMGRTDMSAFSRFPRDLGFELNRTKFELCDEAVFLGLMGAFPSCRNGSRIRISLPGGNAISGHN